MVGFLLYQKVNPDYRRLFLHHIFIYSVFTKKSILQSDLFYCTYIDIDIYSVVSQIKNIIQYHLHCCALYILLLL